jgi:hypothetical protein
MEQSCHPGRQSPAERHLSARDREAEPSSSAQLKEERAAPMDSGSGSWDGCLKEVRLSSPPVRDEAAATGESPSKVLLEQAAAERWAELPSVLLLWALQLWQAAEAEVSMAWARQPLMV